MTNINENGGTAGAGQTEQQKDKKGPRLSPETWLSFNPVMQMNGVSMVSLVAI